MLEKIIGLLTIPIFFLNMLGGIIGGIWLAILGEWKLIGIGIFLLFTSHWILSLFMLLSMPIAGLAVYFYGKNSLLGALFGFFSQLYTNMLIVATCAFAFWLCSAYYIGDIGLGYVPYLLWSWGMALGPWYFFASKEPDNEFSAITIFSASVFYFLFLTSLFVSPYLGAIIIVIFGVVQLIVLPIFNMYVASKMSKCT